MQSGEDQQGATHEAHALRTLYLSPQQVREELQALLDAARAIGIERCTVVFGFAWGNDYYPGNRWTPVELSLGDLRREVTHAESLGWGPLTDNDLTLEFPPHVDQFLFCHENDIHVHTTRKGPLFEAMNERWIKLGLLSAGPQL